jgi:hypothetical protein
MTPPLPTRPPCSQDDPDVLRWQAKSAREVRDVRCARGIHRRLRSTRR